MALLESAYDIRCGAALDTGNVPRSCLPIALLYKNWMDIHISRISIHHMILQVGKISTPTACHFPPPYFATIREMDIFRPISFSESPYDNRGGAALDAQNVQLGCLPIALLYEESIDVWDYGASGITERY